MAIFVFLIVKHSHAYSLSIWGLAFGVLFVAISIAFMKTANIPMSFSDLSLGNNLGAQLIRFERANIMGRLLIDISIREKLAFMTSAAQRAYIFGYFTFMWLILCFIIDFLDRIGLQKKILKLFES